MILITHISLALGSILFTGYTYFYPTHLKLKLSYIGTALTLISGFYLVISTGSPILKSCVSGLTYLAVETFGIVLVSRRLAKENLEL